MHFTLGSKIKGGVGIDGGLGKHLENHETGGAEINSGGVDT